MLFVPNGVDDWMLDVQPAVPSGYPFDPAPHFICTYIGAHGRWNKIETILEAAKILEGTRVRFLLIGDGDFKAELKRYAASLQLKNVCFFDAIPKQQGVRLSEPESVALICTWNHEFQRMILATRCSTTGRRPSGGRRDARRDRSAARTRRRRLGRASRAAWPVGGVAQ